MALPRFFDRVSDALRPVAPAGRAELEARLTGVLVRVVLSPTAQCGDPGPALAVNLLARLYPSLALAGSSDVVAELASVARAVNPDIDLGESPSATRIVALGLDADPASSSVDDARSAKSADTVRVNACGWNVLVDPPLVGTAPEPPEPLAALAAACVAVAEVFRIVFADALPVGYGRTGPQPGGFNLITCGDPTPGLPALVHLAVDAVLVGAGAVGQAALLAVRAAGAVGHLAVVDPEVVELSNLQRYVLSRDADVGRLKTDVAASPATPSATGSPGPDGLTVLPVPTAFGRADLAAVTGRTAMVALDTSRDRLAVAAALPAAAYNAWTQPADLGWSRHEQFGTEPCLACLYYPSRPRPGEHELVALALGIHPLRALGYLTNPVPIGAPLPVIGQIVTLPPPPDAARWLAEPVLNDLLNDGRLTPEEAAAWRNRPLGQLYRDGVCAGGLLRLSPADTDTEAMVPLAHQSALAGVMLATSMLVGADPVLRELRPHPVEARLDLLRGFPQVLPRPRQRTPGCLCSDADYIAAAQTLDCGAGDDQASVDATAEPAKPADPG